MVNFDHNTLIAFGSNKNSLHGDARETVVWAAKQVARMSLDAPCLSKLYATPAFPAGSGPDFVNAAMAITTDLPAPDLLVRLHALEAAAQRTRDVRWGPRTLDLDLIAMGDAVLPDDAGFARWRDLPIAAQLQETPEHLILPHPRLQDRSFVLVPLCDVAPDWTHPVLGQTIAQMAAGLSPQDRATVTEIGRFPDLANSPDPR